MKARSVARELALFALFQYESKGKTGQWDKLSLEEIIVLTVRCLTDLARSEIEAVAQQVAEIHDVILDYEMDHPENEDVPLELPTQAVPLPNTHQFMGQMEKLINAINELQLALELPEMNALSERADVRNYCLMLVRSVLTNLEQIDRMIDDAATDWRVERLQKMDRAILRLAIAELKYVEHVDPAVVIDESMELAKRFTQEDSRKFINGILGALIETPEIQEKSPEEVT